MTTPLHSSAPTAPVVGHGLEFSEAPPANKFSGNVGVLLAVIDNQSDEVDKPAPPKKKRVYKKRKSTHAAQKEERHTLEEELKALQTKLEALKLQALVQSGGEDVFLRKQIGHNFDLQAFIHEHHLVVARAQSMLMGWAQHHSYTVRPTETYIHLTADPVERHETLAALRELKLEQAKRFIEQRSTGLHPTAEYFDEERYETPEGDFCNVRFDRVPLRGVAGGVGAVFAALKRAVFNAEIILSEASGNITIRENDDMDDMDGFSQMKLVTETTQGGLVENNLVHFSELVAMDDETRSYALAAVDFVDEDDLFPYCSHERIRRDATSVILVTSAFDKSNPDPVVVVTRWTFTCISSKLDISAQVLREMRDRSGQVSEIILNCVRETLNLPK